MAGIVCGAPKTQAGPARAAAWCCPDCTVRGRPRRWARARRIKRDGAVRPRDRLSPESITRADGVKVFAAVDPLVAVKIRFTASRGKGRAGQSLVALRCSEARARVGHVAGIDALGDQMWPDETARVRGPRPDRRTGVDALVWRCHELE